MDKYTKEQKDALTVGGAALFFITLAVIAAAIAVGILYGAGYGFGLFAICTLIFGLYLYLCATLKAYRLKKSHDRYEELLRSGAMKPTVLDTSADSAPTFTVINTGTNHE